MALLKSLDSRGVIVTCAANDQRVDFVSRCFFPAIGIEEDPVTGSAHCCLGAYWSARLNKNKLYALQASAREGYLKLEVSEKRILISGQAVTTLRGELVSI